MFNESIRYSGGTLSVDGFALDTIAQEVGTPFYIYSLPRALANLARIREAFAPLNAHIHYSAKANANLAVLSALVKAGAGVDAVSAGEVYKALKAGAPADQIVFAGVGKTPEELRFAIEQGVGWFNVENVDELHLLNTLAAQTAHRPRVALRLNPEVTANTHPYIATGHGAAKFGLTADTIRHLLESRGQFVNIDLAGIHVHIGSQLHDIDATCKAVQVALDLIAPFPFITSVNIGGGLPVAYKPDQTLPEARLFADALTPLLKDREVLIEPGRSIIADAGVLVTRVLYVKQQAGETFVICDASMAELIRPALYSAYHHIVPLRENHGETHKVNIVGAVCETTDVLGRGVELPTVKTGDLLAVLTAGAYGMVMASNYNARTRPPEVVIEPDASAWRVARRRETWEELIAAEL